MGDFFKRAADWIDQAVMNRLIILLQTDEGESFRDIYRKGYDSVVDEYLDRNRETTQTAES